MGWVSMVLRPPCPSRIRVSAVLSAPAGFGTCQGPRRGSDWASRARVYPPGSRMRTPAASNWAATAGGRVICRARRKCARSIGHSSAFAPP